MAQGGSKGRRNRRSQAARKRHSQRAGRPASSRKIAQSPQDAAQIRSLLQQADRFRMQGDVRRAGQAFQQVLMIHADFVPALFGLSQCLARSNHLDRAIELARRAVDLEPDNPLLHAGLADICLMKGLTEKAERAARNALDREPDHPLAHQIIGRVDADRGEYDQAIIHLQKAQERLPDDPVSITELARLMRLAKRSEEAIGIIQKAVDHPAMPKPILAGALHEAAMIHDAVGRTDEAFEFFQKYGTVTAELPQSRQYDRSTRLEYIERQRDIYTPERLTRFRPDAFADEQPAPAFLVGFPRSGTTMMEQVLDAHPQIVTAEEPPYFSSVKKRFSSIVEQADDPGAMFDALNADKIRELRRCYWEAVESDRGRDFMKNATLFLHKLPLLIHDLGLLNAVFPDARVIVALRDPRDCCLSCFMQDFDLNASMVHFLSLADTCRFYRSTFEMYLKMRDHVVLRMLEIRYEDTVRDLEAQSRRVLAFLGVEWDPAVLAYHERARQKHISTPSGAAVREPVYTRAVARWKRYEKFLQPYLPELEPFIETFGYTES